MLTSIQKNSSQYHKDSKVTDSVLCPFQVTGISTSSSSSSSSSSRTSSSSSSSASGTAAGGGDGYGDRTNPDDGYDGYDNYYTYEESTYEESTAAPEGDSSRRVTISGVGTGGELDLGAGSRVDLESGTGVERRVVTGGGGSSFTITTNKTSVSSWI